MSRPRNPPAVVGGGLDASKVAPRGTEQRSGNERLVHVQKGRRPLGIHIRLPRLLASTVEAGPERDRPVLDGSDVVTRNCWNVAACTIAMIGRPAVWVAVDLRTPRIALGPIAIPALRLRWEQDFGGHLFLALARRDATDVRIIEAGPRLPNKTGGLVPFRYPEDHFAKLGLLDFNPLVIEPPHGIDVGFFEELIARTQREYDGDQRYLAIEIPFLRVGRDSNSYTVGLLLACGVDPRAIPKPQEAMRFEITGYPGAEDPVHLANFGAYLGRPYELGNGVLAAAYHDADGSVRLVAIGGEPHGRARTPRGEVALDGHGRCLLAPDDAARHGLPLNHTEPPEQIVKRRRFPR
ncbi:MAG: hypothetical protein M3R44_05005, partial [Candidatus Eremiobacteraeota bacterium]|nr:hypothetical protein [Candidatus Eremiobacteraeota bacterium]